MKYLIISSLPFTNSNRGIDILTSSLIEEGHHVEHLVFPTYYFKKNFSAKITANTNGTFNQNYSKRCFIPYHYSTMHWLPNFVTKIIHNLHLRTVTHMDFEKYDVIVLESGKPVMLINRIPEKVKLIYRQSDPVWMLMPKSNYLKKLENKVIERANLVLVVRKVFKDFLPNDLASKAVVWRNGFNIPDNMKYINPFPASKEKNAVYVGLAPIDYETLEFVATEHPDVNFHIIGDRCLKTAESKRLSTKKNIFVHGFMTAKKYLPYVANADFAIVPYAKHSKENYYMGLTSKFLMFMFYKLPIVSYRPRVIEEFANLPVLFADDVSSFSDKVNIAKTMGKIEYDIDFSYYSYGGRKKELLHFLKNFDLID